MKARKLLNHLLGKSDAINPAPITLRNIYAVLQSWLRQKRMTIAGLELPQHTYEQILWRRVQVIQKSSKCWKQGSCIFCGCDTLGKTMEDRSCEGGCYPLMMDKKQWEQYKEKHQINLFD